MMDKLLEKLIATWENETVEFKQADNSFSTQDIGKYFSALANAANLADKSSAWLIFGVNDKTRLVVGTNYREDKEKLNNLKKEMTDLLSPKITFRNIHEFLYQKKRVIMFEIPSAPRGIMIASNGQYYGRAGESIVPLGLDKQDEIRNQTINTDWTAQIVPDATIEHLDCDALAKVREHFIKKYPNQDVVNWSDILLLERANILQNGKLTRTALLLLGKSKSSYLLSPHPAQITWKLEGQERAYEHLGLPFLLTTTKIYERIRNIQIRLLPNNTLIPYEIAKYDQKMVLEVLHNCIAHQDYMRCGRINVIEQPEKLIFENEGNFYEGHPDDYILHEKMPRRYRNPFLAEAMVTLNMVDKMGFGIRDMHIAQSKRYLPLPDYDVSDTTFVRITIYGGMVDEAYSKMLMENTDLPFEDIMVLDRIQKKFDVPEEAVQRLRRKKLIEGRKPHLHISAYIAEVTEKKADYIKGRKQKDTHYQKLIIDYIKQFGSVSRQDIDKLLFDILSPALDEKQKQQKISNLITNMRRKGTIKNQGSDKHSQWILIKNAE